MERCTVQPAVGIKDLDPLVAEPLDVTFDKKLFIVAASGQQAEQHQRQQHELDEKARKYVGITHSVRFLRQKYEIILNFASGRQLFSPSGPQ